MTRDPFDDDRITAMGLLVEVYAGVTGHFAPMYTRHGVSTAEFEVMIRLARSPGRRLRMSDLAAQTTLSTSGVTRVVDRLERDGLVGRAPCASDRRGFFAVLTAAGAARLTAMMPEHNELVDRWFLGSLPEPRREQFLAALRVIRDVVRPCATAGSDCPATGDPPPGESAATGEPAVEAAPGAPAGPPDRVDGRDPVPAD